MSTSDSSYENDSFNEEDQDYADDFEDQFIDNNTNTTNNNETNLNNTNQKQEDWKIRADKKNRLESKSPKLRNKERPKSSPNDINQDKKKSMSKWTVYDVCEFIGEKLGFNQYRKKFLHHQIQGELLIKLSMDDLKNEIGIGPLGHRYTIFNEIQNYHKNQLNASRPSSAPQQKLNKGEYFKLEEKLKLQNKLEKYNVRLNQKKNIMNDLVENIDKDEGEVRRIKGRIIKLSSSRNSNYSDSSRKSIDSNSLVPWYPVGEKTKTKNLFTEKRHQSFDEVFRPKINKNSNLLLERCGRGKSFMERLEQYNKEKKEKELITENNKKEKVISDGDLKKYLKIVSVFVNERLGHEIPKEEEKLNELIEENYEVFQLGEKQKNKIIKSKYNTKIRYLANAIKTVYFMERYKNEMNNKEEQLKMMKEKWEIPEITMNQKNKYENDLESCKKYFEELGWPDVEERYIEALLNRVKYLKEEKEKGKEIKIDWTTKKDAISSDNRNSINKDKIQETIDCLSGMTFDELEELIECSNSDKKLVLLYRILRREKFLLFTKNDLKRRNEKIQEIWHSLQPKRKTISKEKMDEFFKRLLQDENKRKDDYLKMMELKKSKESEMIANMVPNLNLKRRRRKKK